MQLVSLSVINFKNIAEAELRPSPKLTCLTGSNGAGKTNLLDAVYLLSMCKSSAGVTDRQCIRQGENFFVLKGEYIKDSAAETVACGASHSEGKTIKRNGKAYKRIADHLGVLPLVMISPADSALIYDSGEARRRYLNSVLVQIDKRYLDAANRYALLLAQRNRALKIRTAATDEVIDAIDIQMAQYGQAVFERRTALAETLKEPFRRYYSAIAGNTEQADIEYLSDLQTSPLARLLHDNRSKDNLLQFTSAGVHRDELRLTIGGYPARRLGSQGQQTSVLLALKLAQADVLKQRLNLAPILLLDDIFDKLDPQRIANLINLVADSSFGQIILTDSHKERINALLGGVNYDNVLFEIRNGGLFNV